MKKTRYLLSLAIFVCAMAISSPVFAASLLTTLLGSVYKLLLPIAIGFIAIPMIISSGYKLMTSQGQPDRVKDGKEGVTYAIYGLLFLFFGMALLKIILRNILGRSV